MLHAGTGRSGAPGERCPETPVELFHVEVSLGRLGSDVNGRALVSDMREWWDEHGITDPGQREAYELLWRAIESETNRYMREQHQRPDVET